MRILGQWAAIYGLLAAAMFPASVSAADAGQMQLDPKAIKIVLPDKIPWGPVSAQGSQQAVLYGDLAKPGEFYAVLTKWTPNHMSKPHFHANDRFIQVISGTWWVGTGDKWDPNASVPVPAGSAVTHYGKQVHWDGAKEGETILLIMGIGPAESIPSPTAH